MRISRRADDDDGSLQSTISYDPLPAIQTTWHPKRIDVLSLKQTKRYRSNVHEVLFEGYPAIAKIACFDWEIPRIENETLAYSIINQHQHQHPDSKPSTTIAPDFLDHLTEGENGRVIGFLLEKVDGEFASTDDLPECEEALRRLHGMGLIHGDVNLYNFIVDRSSHNNSSNNDGHVVRMVEFDHAEDFDETKARLELESLASQLAEETGRGGPAVEIG